MYPQPSINDFLYNFYLLSLLGKQRNIFVNSECEAEKLPTKFWWKRLRIFLLSWPKIAVQKFGSKDLLKFFRFILEMELFVSMLLGKWLFVEHIYEACYRKIKLEITLWRSLDAFWKGLKKKWLQSSRKMLFRSPHKFCIDLCPLSKGCCQVNT